LFSIIKKEKKPCAFLFPGGKEKRRVRSRSRREDPRNSLKKKRSMQRGEKKGEFTFRSVRWYEGERLVLEKKENAAVIYSWKGREERRWYLKSKEKGRGKGKVL